MKTRSLEEVVISLEGKVSKTLALYSNMDNNIKVLLNQINQINQTLQEPLTEMEAQQFTQSRPQMPAEKIAQRIEALPPEDFKNPNAMEGFKVGFEPTDFDDEGNPILQEVAVPKGNRRGERKLEGGAPRVAVSQRIVFPNGDPLFLGAVSIKDSSGTILRQTRTNSQGRWVAGLSPGEYSIQISKRGGEDGSPEVELKYSINVPVSKKPVEFPSPQLEEG